MTTQNSIIRERAFHIPVGRRLFFKSMALATAGLTLPGAFAQELARAAKTARVEEGPFYPPKLPLDTDNDLIILNDALTPAVGEITHLSGKLLDTSGAPIRNAAIEIWSTDHDGVYLADRPKQTKFDAGFQGFGRFVTSSTGEYYFRTIKPVRYPGRQAPHIHYKVKIKGRNEWTTQLFIKGDPGNPQDGVFRGLSESARSTVMVDFLPMKDSPLGELAARFDIIVGLTPEDDAQNARGSRGGGGNPPAGGRGGARQ